MNHNSQNLKMTEQPKILYLVWQDGEDEQYYNQYTDLVDAVSSEGTDVEIFKADIKSVGTYELITKLVKKTKTKGKK